MTRWAPWLIVLVAAGAFGLWERAIHDPFVRKVATLQASNDSLDRSLVQLRADSARWVDRDKVLRDSVGVLLTRVTPKMRIDTLILHADTSFAEVARELPDSLKPKMWAAKARQDTVIAELLADRANLLGVIALMNRQITLRDTALAGTRLALLEALQQRDAWRKVARPSLAIRILRDVPKLAVAGVVGWLLH